MRHRVAGRQFGRTTNQRKALLRGLVVSLFEHVKIETTVAKAKEAKKLAERLITLAKKGDLHSRRLALSLVPNKTVISKLFNIIAPKITNRNSGYLRIVRTRVRQGDCSSMAILEFVDYDTLVEKKVEKKKEEKKKNKKEEKKES
ncbi:MAG: 50S ribosomal protein L17 [Nitrospiraceae bacterium]|nr:MAG: 50S ribosomal protein L17 [Nitrospiraceae bacterium]